MEKGLVAMKYNKAPLTTVERDITRKNEKLKYLNQTHLEANRKYTSFHNALSFCNEWTNSIF